MSAQTMKLARVYRIKRDEAQVLVDAGLDTPRKIKTRKGKLDGVKLPKAVKDKIKMRGG